MSTSDAALSILEQKNAHLSAALTQARQELLRLREQLKHLNQPPLTLGILHRAQPSSRVLEVYVSGRLMRLAADTSLDITSISPGQQVLIDDKMIVAGIGEYSRTGELAQVAELIGVDRAVVSAEAGGSELRTMFIDEGFGSLDSHTLSLVMAQLQALRCAGRTVGVISHVEEMATQIADQIQVRPLPEGGSTLSVRA